MSAIAVAALYRFHPLPHYSDLRQPLFDLLAANRVCGTLLLAAEGLNGTIAGPAEAMEQVVAEIARIAGLPEPLQPRWSTTDAPPFGRLKVRLKKEIVTMGVPGIDPLRAVGTYVEPEDWNALISDPDTLLIDTRNSFEVEYGTFKGAVDPGTTTFGQFPDYVRRELDPARHRKVAMFCTGGIRCEKATAYMLEQGFGEVYHLKGGILNYLERIGPEDSLWEGGCFVFDERVALGHGLAPVPGACRTHDDD
ncbi:rhodanese-related sulfurtransferase [Niveispirillum sp.]|uniref:oxygen-dependent tRNA uridine(34) hydroxylase TrhO n=1 Tax=Niveispirillum sp. TaxID=1917217 RepID=UPI001B6DF53C|nr:rhodanese-related sulfurtransferase [Niveispirillum sp.]MBP7337132.1 rhodanese-related sulfurtransferase [Niveispirillum sp.]